MQNTSNSQEDQGSLSYKAFYNSYPVLEQDSFGTWCKENSMEKKHLSYPLSNIVKTSVFLHTYGWLLIELGHLGLSVMWQDEVKSVTWPQPSDESFSITSLLVKNVLYLRDFFFLSICLPTKI